MRKEAMEAARAAGGGMGGLNKAAAAAAAAEPELVERGACLFSQNQSLAYLG